MCEQSPAEKKLLIGVGALLALLFLAQPAWRGLSRASEIETYAIAAGDFEAKLNSTVAGALKDQTQALTAWMEPGGSNQSTDITQAVTTNITFADVQDCMTTLSGRQLLVVSGNSNVVTDNLQAQTVAAVTNCMM